MTFMRVFLASIVFSVSCATGVATKRRSAGGSAEEVRVCTVIDGRVAVVPAAIDAVSRDTLLAGRGLSEVYADSASPYATARAWFIENDPIRFDSRAFFKNAPSRRFVPEELVQIGNYRSAPLFVEAGAEGEVPAIIFVLVNASCSFQGYYYVR